jgi:hypothetical protein
MKGVVLDPLVVYSQFNWKAYGRVPLVHDQWTVLRPAVSGQSLDFAKGPTVRPLLGKSSVSLLEQLDGG